MLNFILACERPCAVCTRKAARDFPVTWRSVRVSVCKPCVRARSSTRVWACVCAVCSSIKRDNYSLSYNLDGKVFSSEYQRKRKRKSSKKMWPPNGMEIGRRGKEQKHERKRNTEDEKKKRDRDIKAIPKTEAPCGCVLASRIKGGGVR